MIRKPADGVGERVRVLGRHHDAGARLGRMRAASPAALSTTGFAVAMKSIIFDGTNASNVGCPESGTSNASDACSTGMIRSSGTCGWKLTFVEPAPLGVCDDHLLHGPVADEREVGAPSRRAAASSTDGSACAIP